MRNKWTKWTAWTPFVMAVVLMCLAEHADGQTNDPGVQLTAGQVQAVDAGITTLLPLVPAKYQGVVAGAILVLTVAAKLGRLITGWRAGGFLGALKAVFSGSVTAYTPGKSEPNVPKGGQILSGANTK